MRKNAAINVIAVFLPKLHMFLKGKTTDQDPGKKSAFGVPNARSFPPFIINVRVGSIYDEQRFSLSL